MNLTDFFEKYGFLKPVDIEVNDYGKKRFVVDAEDVKQLKKEIKKMKLPKPSDAFWYITDNTVNLYKKKVKLKPGTVICKGNTFTTRDGQGVVAYEVEQKGKLVFVSSLSEFTVEGTKVDDSMKLYAVGIDGKRKKVNFKWTEDTTQWKKMQERNSKLKNMYNR